MNQKTIPLDKLEDVLEDLFALSDGEHSEDDNESDENDTETIFIPPSNAELQEILDPNLPLRSVSVSNLGIESSSPAGTVVSHTSSTQPHPSPGTSRLSPVLTTVSATPIPRTITLPADVVDTESSDDSSDSDDGDEHWKKAQFPHKPPIDKFDDRVLKPKQFIPNRSSPAVYFRAFFTDEILATIVDQTNLYATQNRQKDWEPVTIAELKAFFGILIFMGLHVLPNVTLYWSSDPLFCVKEVADVMPVKRFKKILSNLHINDNSKMPKRNEQGFDKLYKVRPLTDSMNDAFQNSASCSSSQSIDECMIKFKGRSTLKQYMPKKPIKGGFKVWARCDSLTGYLYQFEVYTGKKDDTTEVGLGASVVKGLCKKLIEQNAENTHVAFDNFFASCELMQFLFEKNIYSTATVRQDRTNLPELIKSHRKKKNTPKPAALKLAKGQHKWRVNKNVAFFVWMDTKLVYVLSTAYHPRQKKTCKRTQKDGTKSDIACPLGILEYTKRMGGVDRFDQKRGTYPISRRSKRWWMRIFYFLLDAAITNAHILHTHNDRVHNPIGALQFRTDLARNLINNYSSRKRRVSVLPNFATKRPKGPTSRQKSIYGIPDEIRLNDVGSHMPGELPSYRRCRACSSKALGKKSKIECVKCHYALHLVLHNFIREKGQCPKCGHHNFF